MKKPKNINNNTDLSRYKKEGVTMNKKEEKIVFNNHKVQEAHEKLSNYIEEKRINIIKYFMF